uniref:Uncharacterized protein n=1 Tax=Lotharella globosa TaxID=91324 RepID=A0A7S3Z3I6_9EUKA|mmetsp:Transcript_4084/g.8146  ORF Transcript_4084/g.8146 Transcript_4084/m.8146 type:complete len:203 (+) Transcript_4084:628-1236(+)
MQFGVNHLGHFLLTELLLPKLIESAPSRIVNTSSVGHAAWTALGQSVPHSTIDFDDLMFKERKYDPMVSYGQSKLANVLHALHLAKLMEEKKVDVTVVSHHPGWVATDLVRSVMPVWVQNYLIKPFRRDVMDIHGGAQVALHCLLDPSVPQHSGKFFSQTGLYQDKKAAMGGLPMESPNPEAKDEKVAERLYKVSRELVKLD